MAAPVLVTEQIEAGAEFADRFNGRYPVSASFWLKDADDDAWTFNVASDQVNSGNLREADRAVLRLNPPASNYWLDPFQIRVIPGNAPLARDVVAIQTRYPALLPTMLSDRILGGKMRSAAYVYPALGHVKVSS